jgi:hypothetical protein
VPIVWKSGSLSLLEPSGPFQTCNEIALTFYLYVEHPYFVNTFKYYLDLKPLIYSHFKTAVFKKGALDLEEVA